MRAAASAAPAHALAALALYACASSPPSPFFGDERFLVLGVQPDAEADALAAQLEASGYRVERKLRGQHFTALGASDAEGRPAKVRVVTPRGVALALDAFAGHALAPGYRYALLAPPISETHDADGDGFEEVFVEQTTSAAAPCILIYRVRDSGFVDRVPSSGYTLPPGRVPPWDAPKFCEDPEAESESEIESKTGTESQSATESESATESGTEGGPGSKTGTDSKPAKPSSGSTPDAGSAVTPSPSPSPSPSPPPSPSPAPSPRSPAPP